MLLRGYKWSRKPRRFKVAFYEFRITNVHTIQSDNNTYRYFTSHQTVNIIRKENVIIFIEQWKVAHVPVCLYNYIMLCTADLLTGSCHYRYYLGIIIILLLCYPNKPADRPGTTLDCSIILYCSQIFSKHRWSTIN